MLYEIVHDSICYGGKSNEVFGKLYQYLFSSPEIPVLINFEQCWQLLRIFKVFISIGITLANTWDWHIYIWCILTLIL